MKKTLTIAAALIAAITASAQGGISDAMLKEIQSNQPVANAALSNAIANVAIDDLAKNHKNSGAIDTHFNVETKEQNITNQKQSGRCWMFSGLNVITGNFAQRTDSLRVSLSQDYLFFYDQLEKANLFLQSVINTAKKPMEDSEVRFLFKSPISDGGNFCGVADLADKYGVVPTEAAQETFSAENTSRMSKIITSKLREQGLQLRKMVANKESSSKIQKEKTKMLTDIYRILAMTLGEPVKEFTYAFRDKNGKQVTEEKTYTPQSFYKEVVGGPINGTFIMIMNDPRRDYYKTYEVLYGRHTYDGHNWTYLNLPMDEIEKLAIASLKDSTRMYSSYDVAKQLDRKRGYCDLRNYDYATLFSTDFNMTKAERISTYDSGSTHAMTLCAVDLDKDGKAKKWKVENSWGNEWGQKGYLIMTDDWFREYMFRLVVDKKYVPQDLLEKAKQKPIQISPEDPLFSVEN